MKSDLADITVIVRRETDKAWLVDHGGREPCWLPKSQCEIEPNRDGRTSTLTMPQWLAEEKGII